MWYKLLLIFTLLASGPLLAQESRLTVSDFSKPESISHLTNPVAYGDTKGSRPVWIQEGQNGAGALMIEGHFGNPGQDGIAYAITGKWHLSALNRLEFDAKGDGTPTAFYVILYDNKNRLTIYGPRGCLCQDWNGKSTVWKHFAIDFAKDLPIPGDHIDYNNVRKIAFMTNDGPCEHKPFISRICFDQVEIFDRGASLHSHPQIITPNGDGVGDTAEITLLATNANKVSARIQDSDGHVIKELSPLRCSDIAYKFVWNGKDTAGKSLPQGDYKCDATVTQMGKRRILETPLQIVQLPPLKKAKPVDGFFPIGAWFEANPSGNRRPCDPEGAAKYYDKAFSDLSNHGINLVVHGNWPLEMPDMIMATAKKYGMRIIVEAPDLSVFLQSTQDPDERDVRKAAANYTKSLRNYSPLLRYMICDEPALEIANNWVLVKRTLEDADPDHPCFTTFNSVQNLDIFSRKTNIHDFVMDFYPYSFNASPSSLDEEDWTMAELSRVARDRPTWMVLQAFGAEDAKVYPTRYPSNSELRYQTYLALTHGAKGIIFFIYQTEQGWTGMVDENQNPTPIFKEIGRLASELKAISPILLDLSAINNRPISLGPIQAQEYMAKSGETVLIAVNKDVQRVRLVRFSFPLSYKPSKIIDLRTGREMNFSWDKNEVSVNLWFNPGDGAVLKAVR